MDFPPTVIPFSTLFMFLLALAISLLTSLVNRLLANPEQSKAARKEVAEWQAELKAAQRSGDKKTTERLMKKQKQIFQLQSKMTWQSMKVSLIFIVPLFLIWQFLGTTFQGEAGKLAYMPGIGTDISLIIMNFPPLIWWYLLCSMLFGTIFSHVFGIIEVSE